MLKSSRPASKISPEYALLGFLYVQPLHGYELQRRLQAELHEIWRLSQSQVYNILKRLERQELIKATVQPQEKLPDRELLELTKAGKASFLNWLTKPTRSSARAIRVEFLTRMYFAGQVEPSLPGKLFKEQETFTRKDLDRLKKHEAELPADQRYNRLGLVLRIRQLNSILEWLSDNRSILIEANGENL
jgi:DNA-binding PadR family transcriptional regulator